MTDQGWNETLLGGLIPAVPIPRTPDGTPDLCANEKYAAWMDKQPIDGVAVWTPTGRGQNLDPAHRKAILRTWRDVIGPQRWIVAAVGPKAGADGDSAVSSALEMAIDAAGVADFLLVSPPTHLRGRDDAGERSIEYHRSLAGLGMPLVVSWPPSSDGDWLSTRVLDELLCMPQVAGVFVADTGSAVTLQDVVTHIRTRYPRKGILTGENRLFGYSLYRGCHGALLGLAAICTGLQRAMVDAWFMGELARFVELSRLVDHLAEAVYFEPFEGHVGRLLSGLRHQGTIPSEAVHDPWGPPISEAEEELVRATISALGDWALV
jgi:4-hydroxy-tetrahydrodipicolinate synthase